MHTASTRSLGVSLLQAIIRGEEWKNHPGFVFYLALFKKTHLCLARGHISDKKSRHYEGGFQRLGDICIPVADSDGCNLEETNTIVKQLSSN